MYSFNRKDFDLELLICFLLYPHVTAGAADLVQFYTGSRYDHLHTDHTGSGVDLSYHENSGSVSGSGK